jgi:ACS family glucarate transporter-like MFS transporter
MKPRMNIGWIVLMIFLGTMLNYMDRVNISVAAPGMMKEFGWDAAVLGVVLSSFFWGYFLLQIPAGWLADKFGGRRLMTIAGYLWSIFTVLTPFSRSTGLLAAVRAALGAGEALNLPAVTSLIARWLPPKATARMQGLSLSATALGALIATPLSVFFITHWGWQSVFYFFAAITLIWTVLWQVVTKRAGLPDVPEKEASSTGVEAQPDFIEKPLRSVEVWGSSVAWFSNSYIYYFLLTFLPTYFVKAQHVSIEGLALLGTIPWAVLFIMMNVAGWISDRIAQHSKHSIFWRRMMYAGAYIWAASFMLVAKGATNGNSAVLFISIAVFGLSFTWPNAWSLPVVYSRSKAGLLSGFMNAWGQVAGILAPLITGYAAAAGHWDTAFVWVAAFAFLGAALILATSKWSTDKKYDVYKSENESA